MDFKVRLDLATTSLQLMNAVIEVENRRKDALSQELFDSAKAYSRALVNEEYAIALSYLDELVHKARIYREFYLVEIATVALGDLSEIVKNGE